MITASFDQYTDSWFDIRKGRITGSRFSTMMMGEKSKGYQQLVGELAAEIITGELEENFRSEAMEDGTEKEPEAREHLSEMVGSIDEVGFVFPDEDSKYHEWAGFSPDGIISKTGIHVEIKCPLLKTHFGYFHEGGADEYRWQFQGGLWVMGTDRLIFSSYYPGVKQLVLEIEKNEKDQASIQARIEQTIDRVESLIDKYKKYEYEVLR